MIEHIGIQLFSQQMRTLLPSPIYDYLEFALLNHKYSILENNLQEKKIMFRNGTWDDLVNISPYDDCTIDNRDDKWYIVTWKRISQEPLSVLIPIDYELLANSSRKEMEKNFTRGLLRHKPEKPKSFIIDEDHLESLHRDGILVKKGKSFLVPEINSNTYYRFVTVSENAETAIRAGKVEDIVFEEDLPDLLIDSLHPSETIANILLTPHHAGFHVNLSIELLYAGYHKETINVNLRQWMSYCQSVGCIPYYAYEGNGDAILVMHNGKEGYAHLLYLHCPAEQLEEKEQTYTGKVYMYIPTSNIQELFGRERKNKSTPKEYDS